MEAGIEGNDDKAGFGESLAIDIPRGLLLATADGVGAYDSRIFLAFIEVGREIQIRRDVNAMDPSLLPALAWFAHVAHHRSFTKAAAEMGVSRANLSQNVKALERRLNVKLLYRTTRDMSLTEEGQRLYDVWYPALIAVERTVRTMHDLREEPTGLVRVNTSRVAARTLLEPHLQEFCTRYPKLQLEMVMDDALANIVADGCDAGIRIGESLAEHMVAVPISPALELAVVGTPAYFERYGRPSTPADLPRHDCLRLRRVGGGIHTWEFTPPDVGGHTFMVEPQGRIITNDDDGMIRAALQGAGLMQHLDIAVQQHLKSGALVRVLQSWCKPFAGFYIYAPTRAQMPAKVRALIDFLVEKREGINADKSHFSGEADFLVGDRRS